MHDGRALSHKGSAQVGVCREQTCRHQHLVHRTTKRLLLAGRVVENCVVDVLRVLHQFALGKPADATGC